MNPSEKIKATIVLRVKNEGKTIGKVLDLVLSQETDFHFETILIDSGSTDNTIVESEKRKCTIYRIPPEKFTWGYALNYGAELAKGEFVVYISGHCFPENKIWLKNMIKEFDSEKTAAVYGRQIPNPAGDYFEAVELVYLWFPEDESKLKEPSFSNASCAIRKSILDKHKFDERLSFCEDGEWANRIRNEGYKIKYAPDSTIYHSHEMMPDVIYKRWFLRSYAGVQINNKCRDGSILYFFYKTLKFYYLDIKYLIKTGRPLKFWKIPFYELVRQIAAYNGARAGRSSLDIGNNYQIKLPEYLKIFRKIL